MNIKSLAVIYVFLLLIACGSDTEADKDSDGIPDARDNCIETVNQDQLNTDGDEEGDACDTDDDNDGVLDEEDLFPIDGRDWEDTDQDGTGDNTDNCPALSNQDQANTDGDSAGNVCDVFPDNASETKDFDGDGNGDNADLDDDKDGVEDLVDAFPFDDTEWADVDSDLIGDNKDLHLSSTNPNDIQLQRLFDTGGAIQFIGAQEGLSFGADRIGSRVRNVGDVNGDQLDDLLIAYAGYKTIVNDVEIEYAGIAYLLFSKAEGWPNTIDLGNLANSGLEYVIFENDPGVTDAYGIGGNAAGVGDVNDDGIDDFLLSAPNVDTDTGEPSGGEAYLVFGRDTWSDKNITSSELKNQYAITYYGNTKFGIVGYGLVGMGDMNGDTIPDFLVAEPNYNITEGAREGRSVLMWGGTHLQPPQNNTPIELTLDDIPESQRLMILGTPGDGFGRNTSSVSLTDINNDGLRDFAIGIANKKGKDGQATVLFGKTIWPVTIDLNALNTSDGFEFKYSEQDENEGQWQYLGYDLATGDLNGDGHDDLVVTTGLVNLPTSNVEDIDAVNTAYILWGGREAWPSVFYADILSQDMGATIRTDEHLNLGHSVTVLKDSNGDGKDELVIGATLDSRKKRPGDVFARAYKLNGRENWDNIVLSITQPSAEYEQIFSIKARDEATQNMSVVGDFNHDGLDDFIMDVPNSGGENPAYFYLIYGYSDLPQPQSQTVAQ